MLTLATTNTLQGIAGTATAITYTIFGDEISTVQAYKVLAQGQLAAAAGALYTVPGAPTVSALVKCIMLANATASPVTGVKLFVNGTAAANQITPAFSIPANGLAILDDAGLKIYDSTGSLMTVSVSAAGRYLRTRVFTSGTSFVVSADASSIFCRLLAPGGGGGNCVTAVTNSAAGGGGASGGYAEKTFAVVPGATVTYTVPAGGASATAGANATVVSGGVTVTAMGGPAGVACTVAVSPLMTLGGAAPAVSTNGDLNGSGSPGATGATAGAAVAASGGGGSSLFGGGGVARKTQGVGNAAVGFGSGGGGAVILSGGANTAGGAGSAGLLIVDEFS